MTREETIRRIKAWNLDSDDMEVLSVVVPELTESEDDRIRKILIHIVKGACDKYSIKYKGDEITEEKLLAYLERQKEPHYFPLCKTIKDKIREYIANHFIADTVVKTDMRSIVKAMEEGVRLGKAEQESRMDWSDAEIQRARMRLAQLPTRGLV